MATGIGWRTGRTLAGAALLATASCAPGGAVQPSGGPVATSAGAGLGGVGGAVTPATTRADTGAVNTSLGAGNAGR